MYSLIIDDTASRFHVPPDQRFSTPTKKINCTRYLLLNIISEKPKLEMTNRDRTSMRWCVPNPYRPTRNLSFYSLVKKIPRELAKRIDEIVQSASSANLAATDINLNELPDLETISSKHIPTLRFIPAKFRVRWSEVLASNIDACSSNTQSLENWKKKCN